MGWQDKLRRAKGEMQARKIGFQEEQKVLLIKNGKVVTEEQVEKERKSNAKAYKSQKERQSKEEREPERNIREEKKGLVVKNNL